MIDFLGKIKGLLLLSETQPSDETPRKSNFFKIPAIMHFCFSGNSTIIDT